MVEQTLDHLLGGRVALAQPATGYRAAIDPVLLAAAVEAAPGARVIDLGCGTGGAALCLMARVPGLQVIGIDRDPDAVDFAADNARRNGQAGFSARQLDLLADRRPPSALGPVDQVLSNPPFHAGAASDPSPDPAKRAATIEDFPLAAWLERAAGLLAPRGSLTVIHRADRLAALLAALPKSLGGIAVLPLWPRAGTPAKRVIVGAIKGSRAPLILTAGLVLHRADGGFTAEAEAVLRDAIPLGDVVPGWRRSGGPGRRAAGRLEPS